MSERKVLTKYYPPDFDPSNVPRTKKLATGVQTKLQTVRLMGKQNTCTLSHCPYCANTTQTAPFPMKCTTCGEYIYKGRKFNARKEVTDETYYAIKVIRFYIRCTRCSAELTFKTDPKNDDYAAEKGIRRNFEPWREAKLNEETEEERLDRIEREMAEADPMKELESKMVDAKTEMAVADKLDEIRTRNARMERADKDQAAEAVAARLKMEERDLERERQEREDDEAARAAFRTANGEKVKRLIEDDEDDKEQDVGNDFWGAKSPDTGNASVVEASSSLGAQAKQKEEDVDDFWGVDDENDEQAKKNDMPPPTLTFTRNPKKRKQDLGAALGIKKKPKPPVAA